jgi:hypothetical protein
MGFDSAPTGNNEEVHGDASLLGREDLFGKDTEQYPDSQELTVAEEKKLNEALKKLKDDPTFNKFQ